MCSKSSPKTSTGLDGMNAVKFYKVEVKRDIDWPDNYSIRSGIFPNGRRLGRSSKRAMIRRCATTVQSPSFRFSRNWLKKLFATGWMLTWRVIMTSWWVGRRFQKKQIDKTGTRWFCEWLRGEQLVKIPGKVSKVLLVFGTLVFTETTGCWKMSSSSRWNRTSPTQPGSGDLKR